MILFSFVGAIEKSRKSFISFSVQIIWAQILSSPGEQVISADKNG
jgi:hypothetical protein